MSIPEQIMEIFLQPGDLWFGDKATRIRTILGSCVAVTLWHPGQQVGGMCHFMLPRRPRHEAAEAARDGRYADEAFDMLAHEIAGVGTRPAEYICKLFGGGRMFSPSATVTPAVPDQNVAAARVLADRHGFRVNVTHLGGHGHRHVIHELWNGDTWLKHTPLQLARPVVQMFPPAMRKAA